MEFQIAHCRIKFVSTGPQNSDDSIGSAGNVEPGENIGSVNDVGSAEGGLIQVEY